MAKEYFVTYFDKEKNKKVDLGPREFYGDDWKEDEGFSSKDEAELAMSAAKKAAVTLHAYGGNTHFIITYR